MPRSAFLRAVAARPSGSVASRLFQSGAGFRRQAAEAIFAVHPNVDRMKQYADDLNEPHGEEVQSRAGIGQADLRLADGGRRHAGRGAGEARAHQGLHSARGRDGLDIRAFRAGFSKFSPDEHVQNIEVPGIRACLNSIIYAKGGAPVTVKEAAMIYARAWACRSRSALPPTSPTRSITWTTAAPKASC